MEGCALCSLFEQAQDRLKEVFGQTTLAQLARRHAASGASRDVGGAVDSAPARTVSPPLPGEPISVNP
jgi:hypothetical protein